MRIYTPIRLCDTTIKLRSLIRSTQDYPGNQHTSLPTQDIHLQWAVSATTVTASSSSLHHHKQVTKIKMPSHYTITEPHPTVAQNTHIFTGRHGAGNHIRAPLTTSPAGVPTPIHPVPSNSTVASSSSASSGRFYSGRGGAGNAHKTPVERPVLSFEDEFSRADKRDRWLRSGYLVGRGGAGNFSSGTGLGGGAGSKGRSGSQGSSSSGGSAGSVGSGVLRRLGGVFNNKH